MRWGEDCFDDVIDDYFEFVDAIPYILIYLTLHLEDKDPMPQTHTSQATYGKQGNKRASYRSNAREYVAKLVHDNPGKDKDDLFPLFLERVSNTPAYVATCAEYYWSNQFDYTMAAARGTRSSATPSGKKTPRPEFKHPPPASSVQLKAMLGNVEIARRALLKTYKINRIPLANCTAAQVRAQAERHSLDAYFLYAVADGVPDAELIGKHRTEEEAWQLYLDAMARAVQA